MLTPRQRDALAFLCAEIGREGVAPTVREIAAALNLHSTGRVSLLLRGLEERGFIRRLPGRARAIEVLRSVEDVKASVGGAAS